MNAKQTFDNFSELAIRFNATRKKERIETNDDMYDTLEKFNIVFKKVYYAGDRGGIEEIIDRTLKVHCEKTNQLYLAFLEFCNTTLIVESINKLVPLEIKGTFYDGSKEAE